MSFTGLDHKRLVGLARRAAAGFCLGALVAGGALAQVSEAAPPPPSGRTDGTSHWQRQQPTRKRTQRLFREEGIAQSPQERRRELRTLNQLHRELMPPGTTVPAPAVAGKNSARPGE